MDRVLFMQMRSQNFLNRDREDNHILNQRDIFAFSKNALHEL